jgi:transposase, IS5 family
MIGHLKSDSRMDRNRLNGQLGDKVNAILCAAGKNLKKLMVFLWKGFLRLLLSLLESNFRREILTQLRLSGA